MMKVLAFDTSGPVLSVALQRGSLPIREQIHFGAWEHMENIHLFMNEILSAEKTALNEVDCFLINRGPGSFTGLRIGFATLKGLTVAAPKPCYGFDSLDTSAERIPVQQKNMAVCLDAFRSKFYIKIFENNAGAWTALSAPEALEIHQAIDKIPAGALITGDALKRHRSLFETAPNKRFCIAPEEFWYPRASSMIELYKNRPQTAKKLLSSDDFLPFYLRQSEPEERKQEKVSPKQ